MTPSRQTVCKRWLKISETRFPLGANRDKFIFIGGLGKLNNGDAEGCVTDMNTLVEKFPQSELSNLAGMIVNGVKAGRRIYGGKFDMSNVWERRTETMAPADSTAEKTLSNERNTDFLFIFAYSPDSVDENRLLYELAKYNFTSYMVRNFDIVIEPMEGINRMTVSGFRNYDEALQYARQLYGQQNIIRQAAHSRTIIISKTNLPLLGTKYSYDDYDKFYNKHFAPLKVSTLHLLTEPTEITTVRRKDNGMTSEEIDRLLDNGTFIDNGLDVEPVETGTIVAPEETAPEKDDGGTVIPAEGTNDEGDAQGGTTIVPEPETPVQPEKKPENVDEGVTVSPAADKQKEDRKDEAMRQENTVSPAPGKTEDVKKDVVTEPDDSIIIPLEELKDDSTQKEKPKEEPKQPLKKEDEGGKTTPKKKQEEDSGQEKKQPAEQLEEEFYFDDTPQDTGNKRKKDVPDVTDDEYYDLKGF